ncbi:tetratricopeptide repeat protein [Hippea maritima]|uniref:Uncharacterized protein n=1 Tax=Hippea maritima (strain ATCC 700847 / DSM 10411 / MH2) TaxID=760142 RepID=F2LVY0_HIPMA|nr:tetratricopeptide repeat protein [Hippea maritima]AEA33914.1 hypothetical protein Hipma_0945 [Hippea maritima DSM 10411]
MFRFVFIFTVLAFLLTSCGFDDNLIIKRLNLLEGRVDFNSKRIDENSKKIDEIAVKLQKIKERLAKERESNILAKIPPASVVDNLTNQEESKGTHVSHKSKNIYPKYKVAQNQKEKDQMDNSSVSLNNFKINKEKEKGSAIGNKSNHMPIVPAKDEIDNASKKLHLPPTNYKQVYKKALLYYKKKDFKQAELLFCKFINSYKNTDLYDNALYWLAYTYIHQNETGKAIKLLKEIIEQFPNGSVDKGGKTDAAIFALIKIYKKQNEKDLEEYYKNLLIKKFPSSRYVNLIKRRRKG